MTLIVNGFLGPLLLTGGLGAASGPVLVSYVDPTAVTLVSEPSSDSDIDPTQVSLIQ